MLTKSKLSIRAGLYRLAAASLPNMDIDPAEKEQAEFVAKQLWQEAEKCERLARKRENRTKETA